MLDRLNISAIQPGDEIRETYLLASAQLSQSRNGPYWRLELRDASGKIEAKIWHPLSSAFSALVSGRIVLIQARAELFREQLQLNISDLQELNDDQILDLDITYFLPASSRSASEILKEIESLLKNILKHKAWRKFARSVLQDEEIRPALLRAPAAKNIHHAYCGGLVEHSLSVAKLCLRLADHYPDLLDRQLLFCAALFHDLGKIRELGSGLDLEYTSQGKMLGHISLGLIILEPFLRKSGLEPELAMHLRHLIASHHGVHEYGAPVLPSSAEAFALHYADNIDAKLAQVNELFAANGPRPSALPDQELTEWTPWQNLLERRLSRPPCTPDSDKQTNLKKDAGGLQCSLL